MLEFGILGPLEVRHEGRLVDLGGAKIRVVLAVLLLRRGEPVTPDVLIQALWGAEAPPTAARTLHVHVSRLRHRLETAAERLHTDAAGYRLVVESGELDAERFERGVYEGRTLLAAGRAQEAASRLNRARALWRGPVLADLRYEAFAQAEITRLEELRALALEECVEAELELGEHARLIGELEVLIGEHPTRERLRAQHMLALYRAGRHADALSAYGRSRAELIELGLEPGPALRQLEHAILTHDPQLALRPRADTHGLPAIATPIFGREEALRSIGGLLDESRCLTLVGLGGVGKTRLAIEVARDVGGRFVSLASTASAEHLPTVLCEALDIARVPGEPAAAALDRALGRGPHLLVLDNLEHLPDVAPLLADLLERHASLRLLATSREPLRIHAERLFHVEPLALDAQHSPAVALFVDRARAQDPSFAITLDNAATVADVCARLGGLPLAIELAATRLAVLTPEALAVRLDDALDVLGPGPRDAPKRQQTLRATLDWSYDLLDDAEQDAFRALAAFAGGCEIDAAETVTRVELQVLERLVSQGLVNVRSGRLTMLEPVRQYAVERLAHGPDSDHVRARHLEYHVALAERSEHPVWMFRRSSPEYAALRREQDNLRVAVEWGLESGAALLVLRLVSALSTNLVPVGPPTELRRWWNRAFAAAGPELPLPIRARAEFARATHAADLSDHISIVYGALKLFRELGDQLMTARCLVDIASHQNFQGNHQAARTMAESALEAVEQSGDNVLIGEMLGNIALATTTDIEAAIPIARDAVERLRGERALVRSAELLSTLGLTALGTHAYDRAEQLQREALDDALAVGDPWTVGFVHGNTGLAAFHGGRPEAAASAFQQELTAAHAHGFQYLYFEGLLGMAALAAADRDDERAATLEGAAWALSDRPIAPSEIPIYERLEANLTEARTRLGEQEWQSARTRGGSMTPAAALSVAFESPAVAPS